MAPGTPGSRRRRSASLAGDANPTLRAAMIVFAVCIVAAPELLGGRPGWTVWVITGATGLAAILAGVAARRDPQPLWVDSGPLVAVALGVVWTALQCVPLPAGLAARVNPLGLDDARQAALFLGGGAPSWWTLSRSPWSTLEEVVKGLAIAATFAAAWWHVHAGRRTMVARAIGVSVITMAAVSIAHHVLGAHTVFGVFEPPGMGKIVSPLVNENHLAGFLSMGTPILLALGLDTESRPARVVWWGGGVLVVVTCIAAVSRSGLGSLCVGLVTFAVLYRWRAVRSSPGPWGGRAGAVAVVTGLVLAAVFFADDLAADFGRTTLDKVRLAIRGLDLVAQHPLVGVGRGGYSAAFVRHFGTRYRLEYPESILVQWSSEWGLPVALGILGLLARAYVQVLRTHSPLRIGALAGVLSIFAHEFLDFATEETGVVVVASAVLALALAAGQSRERRGSASSHAAGRAISWRAPVAIGAVAVLVAGVVGPGIGRRRPRAIVAAVTAAVAAHDDDVVDAALRRGMSLHPSEPAFPLLAAQVAIRRGDANAVRYFNRAMTLAPGWVAPHTLAARWLAARGAYGQAWLELREAERREPGAGDEVACELARREEAVEEATRLFAGLPAALDRLADCGSVSSALVERIDTQIMGSGLPGPRIRAARRASAAGDDEASVALLEPAFAAARPQVALPLALAYLRLHRPADAIRVLDDPALEPALGGQGYRALARAYADMGDEESMRTVVGHMRGSAHGSPERLAAVLSFLGSLEHGLGHDGAALRAYEQAAAMYPPSRALADVARLAESMGDHARAYRAWSELCRQGDGSSEACQAAARLRADR